LKPDRKGKVEEEMKGSLLRFIKQEKGTEAVEWAILIGLIVVVSLGLIIGIGVYVQGTYSTLSTSVGAS
jgi:Flp pilus assembly pilin Flp